MIERSGLYFEMVDDVLTVTLGFPGEGESEHILEIHKQYLPDLIAGLTAVKTQK